MATGDAHDLVERVRQLLPRRWFQWGAPFRDALLGGLADGAAQNYSLLTYARKQSRISTASGIFLDLIGWDFFGGRFTRRFGETDLSWQPRILKEILRQRQTRAAITTVLTDLTGISPLIYEAWNAGDAGCYDIGTFAFDAGLGWGSLDYNNQIFITAFRAPKQGIPLVSGWDMTGGGWDVGLFGVIDTSLITGQITDAEIYANIQQTIAAGTTAWVSLSNSPAPVAVGTDITYFIPTSM